MQVNRGIGIERRHHHCHDSEVSDSSSDASSSPSSSNNGKKKKAGVNNKVNIPNFGGKYANPQNAASAFRDWARIINHYREYYEDEYLMTQVAGSLKNDAAWVFDWVRHNHRQTGDLGLILRKMRNHYSATLTFQEQRNKVENMRQASGEDAVDFLIRVSNAVQILGNDWKELMTLEEMEILQYEVCLNGVNEDIRHVLDSETAKHGELNSDQMYDAVKQHEAYVAHNKRLQGRGSQPAQAQAPTSSGYKPQFQKATAFPAIAAEVPESDTTSVEAVGELEEGLVEIDPSSEDSGGLYFPDFLTEALVGGNWVLNARVAQAIQADEQLKKRCFACQSPDHFIRDCPQAKNGQRPLQLSGPPKNNLASVSGKEKTPSSMPTLPEHSKNAPQK